MLTKTLELTLNKKYIYVLTGGVELIRVSRLPLKSIFTDPLKKTKKKVTKKKVSNKKVTDEKAEKKAIQLSKKYILEKCKFYKKKKGSFSEISRNSKQFKTHFVQAAQIIIRHDAKIRTFLKAQVDGLTFVNDGIGTFPSPNMLSTDSAETRLLEYIRKQNFEDVHVELSERDKETSLNENRLYASRYKRFEKKEATLKEALYIRECQLFRLREVEEKVERYIKKYRKED